jgi:uncharacterized protein YjbI with pentapeptide repeats
VDLIDIFTIIGVLATIYGVYVAIKTYWYPILEKRENRRLLEKELGEGPFDTETINRSIQYYIRPRFSNLDPAREKEMRHALTLAIGDLFKQVDLFLDQDSGYHHLLILADSGTGKTSFILNYYAYNLRKRNAKHKISLVPLGLKDADGWIAKIPDKKERVIFLDALDEDTKAIQDHRQRISDLMMACEGFKRVVITCRTQFFSRDEEIPVKTGVVRISPRKAGEKGRYEFRKLYLAPFDDNDVTHYIKQRYPFWNYPRRKKAFEIVEKIPLLTVRPMLLAHIPDLIEHGVGIKTSYQLYEVMVEAWLDRESGWVDKEALRAFSEQLAVDLFVNRKTRGEEQVTKEELSQLAQQWGVTLEGWKLSGRSLLNRDATGNYKFAHRSIMEFLFVKPWLDNDEKARQVALTDQMSKFLAETDLAGADLSETNLSGINLSGINLSGMNLSGADLVRANLSGANLSGANLSGANLSGANLSGANLSGADLSGADLTYANLRKADFSRADFRRANLTSAHLGEAHLKEAHLKEARLLRAYLSDGNLIKADLRWADLRWADFARADLRRADLSDANLTGTNLSEAMYNDGTKWPKNFNPTVSGASKR